MQNLLLQDAPDSQTVTALTRPSTIRLQKKNFSTEVTALKTSG